MAENAIAISLDYARPLAQALLNWRNECVREASKVFPGSEPLFTSVAGVAEYLQRLFASEVEFYFGNHAVDPEQVIQKNLHATDDLEWAKFVTETYTTIRQMRAPMQGMMSGEERERYINIFVATTVEKILSRGLQTFDFDQKPTLLATELETLPNVLFELESAAETCFAKALALANAFTQQSTPLSIAEVAKIAAHAPAAQSRLPTEKVFMKTEQPAEPVVVTQPNNVSDLERRQRHAARAYREVELS